MGLFSFVGSLVRGAVNVAKSVGGAIVGGVKKVGGAIVSGAKKAAGWVKEKATGVWNKFTGKDKYLEAQELYDKITADFNRRKTQFDKDLDRIGGKIDGHIENINKYKEKIIKELFARMAEDISKIKDIKYDKDFTIEEYKAAALKLSGVRDRSELFKIDFDNHEFKAIVKRTLKAIITFGFKTRKEARESLYAVQEEERKVKLDIAKMDAETTKLERIEQSLDNVEHYFETLVSIYEQLLVRLDNSVKHLTFRCMGLARKIISVEMSIKRLPIMQQKDIEAIITASKILKKMTEAKLVSVENKNNVEAFDNELKKQHDSLVKTYEAA